MFLSFSFSSQDKTNFSKFCGDGWKLVSENELTNNNNPFSELLDKMKEE